MELRSPGSGIFGLLFLKRVVGQILFEGCFRRKDNSRGDAVGVEFLAVPAPFFKRKRCILICASAEENFNTYLNLF